MRRHLYQVLSHIGMDFGYAWQYPIESASDSEQGLTTIRNQKEHTGPFVQTYRESLMGFQGHTQ